MQPLVNIALRAARDAAESLAHRVDRLDRIRIIDRSPGSYTSSMDEAAEQCIFYHLQKTCPEHTIISRLSGEHSGREGEPVWLIDPVVGSRNLANGHPDFGVSLAVRIKQVITHAVIIRPMVHEEYVASRGKGAQLNSRRIRVDDSAALANALIGLNDLGLQPVKFLALQQALMTAGASPRISGCSPLDMVATACGKLQGGWSQHLDEPSCAAAGLILQEAGGLLGTEDGNPRLDRGKEIFFANPRLYKQLIKLRRSVLAECNSL